MEDPDTVAAILVEPIGHTGGVIDPPEEYLPILREICDRHNVLLIFDEIITGFGRTGHLFAAETFGVVPDVLCIAKGMSGGYAPLSAMICRRPIADAFWGPIEENPGFVEGHTFEGNPISCAAGIAVLREILERDLCGNARTQGARLRAGFERLAEKHGVIGDIRGKGLFQAIEFVRDRATKEPMPGRLRRAGRPPRAGERPALPVRPALDRLRPAAGFDVPNRSTRCSPSSTAVSARSSPRTGRLDPRPLPCKTLRHDQVRHGLLRPDVVTLGMEETVAHYRHSLHHVVIIPPCRRREPDWPLPGRSCRPLRPPS